MRRPLVVAVCFLASLAPRSSTAADDLLALRTRLEQTLQLTQRRYLDARHHTPWQIFHGILAFGPEFRIRWPDGQVGNAIQYVCHEATIEGQRLFRATPYGLEVVPSTVTEGHPDQFLAILAMSGVPITQPIIVGNLQYQVHHLVTQAQYDYYRGREASWTLIALSTYLEPTERWRNRYGDVVSLRLIARHELELAPDYAPCGGTHNLYALGYALRQIRRKGYEPARDDVWQQAVAKLQRYVALTQQYQSSNGAFSSEFYRYPATSSDPEEVMYTTGHTLEWLTVYLSTEQLRSGWVRRAVARLLDAFDRTAEQPVSCGPLYHATHALRLYYERVFAEIDQSDPATVTAGH